MALQSVQEALEAVRRAHLHTWQEGQRVAATVAYLDSDVVKLRARVAVLEAKLRALEARG